MFGITARGAMEYLMTYSWAIIVGPFGIAGSPVYVMNGNQTVSVATFP